MPVQFRLPTVTSELLPTIITTTTRVITMTLKVYDWFMVQADRMREHPGFVTVHEEARDGKGRLIRKVVGYCGKMQVLELNPLEVGANVNEYLVQENYQLLEDIEDLKAELQEAQETWLKHSLER